MSKPKRLGTLPTKPGVYPARIYDEQPPSETVVRIRRGAPGYADALLMVSGKAPFLSSVLRIFPGGGFAPGEAEASGVTAGLIFGPAIEFPDVPPQKKAHASRPRK